MYTHLDGTAQHAQAPGLWSVQQVTVLHTGVLGRSPSQLGLPSYKMTKLCTSMPSVLLGVSNVGHQTHWSLQHSSSFPPQGLCTCGSFSSPILRRSLLLQAILSVYGSSPVVISSQLPDLICVFTVTSLHQKGPQKQRFLSVILSVSRVSANT